jgi:beta-N-acetylhexosaminidase
MYLSRSTLHRVCLFLFLSFLALNCTTQYTAHSKRNSLRPAKPNEMPPEITETPPSPSSPAERGVHRETETPSVQESLSIEHARLISPLMEKMSLEQRVAQRFMTWIPGTGLTNSIEALIRKGNLGGILLNSYNIQSKEQIKGLTKKMQELALNADPPVGLLIGVDQEGGRVNRFGLEGMTRFPAPFYLGGHNDADYIRSVAYITGIEIREMGCNMNLAPVLDLYDQPDRSVIGDRSMGNDPVVVGNLGAHYISGAKSAGVIPVIKHFPGQGITTTDSHKTLPVVRVEKRQLIERGILPFRIAIKKGAEAVMTAHVIYEPLDPHYPGTLSQRIVKGLLREELGFNGVVLSDAIEMGALRNNYSSRDIVKLCVKAGVDLLLINGIFQVDDLIAITMDLLKTGEITREEIDTGVERILRMKAKHGLLSK